MRGKKGQATAEKVSVSLLILFVVVLFLAFFSARVFDWVNSKGDVESCRLSVVASGKISDVSMGISTLDLECPRKNIVLSPESYTVDKSEKEYASEEYEKDYSKNVKQVFADQIRECWYKMGEGEVDLFDDNIIYGFDDICVVCSHIEFEDPSEENVGNLAMHIEETAIPLSVQQQEGITYHDYIYRSYSSKDCDFLNIEQVEIIDNAEIDTTKAYDILYKARIYTIKTMDFRCNSIIITPTEIIDQAGCDYTYS